MKTGLDGLWLRHELLANNVANSETPGYKSADLDFTAYLRNAVNSTIKLNTSNPMHITGSSFKTAIISQNTSSITPDGNNVDIDKEMAQISANALHYSALSRQLTSHLSLLKKSITEGRR
ncbi:MAG TPA: flagellar basal body rod protein FlgB [Bacillota bacterium]|nr:flagellar basal body rod protein FlgB [Bacillota bacterium]HPZ77694.1 flagellar basal body rod protein FlgB [Bacillota bacterium]HQD74932.1 flagellar basal body rod protein FlgB [Bacillota bacterium]